MVYRKRGKPGHQDRDSRVSGCSTTSPGISSSWSGCGCGGGAATTHWACRLRCGPRTRPRWPGGSLRPWAPQPVARPETLVSCGSKAGCPLTCLRARGTEQAWAPPRRTLPRLALEGGQLPVLSPWGPQCSPGPSLQPAGGQAQHPLTAGQRLSAPKKGRQGGWGCGRVKNEQGAHMCCTAIIN